MKPIDLVEPLLLYLCRVNRAARKGAAPEMQQVRHEVLARFDDIRRQAGADAALREHFDPAGKGKLMLVLSYVVDGILRDSPAPWAAKWPSLAGELYNELAGDERFFDMLDETLADASEAATDRLEVYYQCLGLGFTGLYAGQAEYLRSKMLEMSTRLRKRREQDRDDRLCPDAYEHVNNADLVETPAHPLVGIAIALVGLVVVLFVANGYLYRIASSEMAQALTTISASESP